MQVLRRVASRLAQDDGVIFGLSEDSKGLAQDGGVIFKLGEKKMPAWLWALRAVFFLLIQVWQK